MTASGSVEAGAIRAYLEDNGIHVFVQGELHNALLGQFGGAAAIDANVMVPRGQLDAARELLEAFRHGEIIDEDSHDSQPEPDEELILDPVALKHDLRRVTMLGCFGFGIAHFAVGARFRSLLLLVMCVGAVPLALQYKSYGALLVPLAIVLDIIGARAVVRARHQTPLPKAQLVTQRKP